MTVLGIVGPMGSGKTFVLETLGRLGAVTIKADDLSRELLQPGAALTGKIRQTFGEEFFDSEGNLLRGKLAELIFASEEARQRLNCIMYPGMVVLLQERLAQLREATPPPALVAVEAANLYEMGADRLVDYILNVTASRPVREQRIRTRDNLTVAETKRRLDAHAAAGLDNSPADFEINTDKNAGQLQAEVEALYQRLTGRST